MTLAYIHRGEMYACLATRFSRVDVDGDPNLKFPSDGSLVLNLRVLHNRKVFNRSTNEWEDKDLTAFDVAYWGKRGQNSAEELHKGDAVVVVAKTLRLGLT